VTGHDQLAKDLVRTFFPDFLDLAAPGAADRLRLEDTSFLDTQSVTDWPAGRRRELDLLARIPSRPDGDAPVLIHVEIERRARPGMDRRMWLYYMQLRLRHGLLVIPILVNLTGGAPGISRAVLAEGVDDPETARFRFHVFSLSGCQAEEYLERSEPLAWALAALMRRGQWSRAEHRLACLRRIAAADLPELQRFLLVNCVETYLQLSGRDAVEYARLVGRAENREVRTMQLTWAEKMEAKGRVQGRSEALETLRTVVLHLLEQRFGPLPERTRRRVGRLRSLRSLRGIAEQVLVANSLRDLGLS
jgi:hypothetical protein